MKFTNGFWMMKDGCTAVNSKQIREVKVLDEGTCLYLYTVSYAEDVRGLGGPMLEYYITSPQPGIIRIQMQHFSGDLQKYPKFELNDNKVKLEINQVEDVITVRSGRISLIIKKRPCSFVFNYDDKKITSVSDRYGASQIGYVDTPQGIFMRAQLDLDVGEKIYGLGERFTPFVKNGQIVETWNEDGGTSSDISYKSIPFYVTNRGYGVFVNDTGNVSYELCSEAVTKTQFSVKGQKLDFCIIGGGDIKTVLQKYCELTGKPALPPAWSFGLWLTSSFTTSYDEKTVTEFIDGMKQRNIPLSVFHFDCFWMKENEWCGFQWDELMFPDVENFLKRLKDKGIKICVWINSYIGQKSPTFAEAAKNGYLLKRKNGDVWQWDLWQAGLGIVDFTNPSAVKWYQDKLRGLIKQGVDVFKTDFGERIPTDCVYYDNSDPERMHNYYAYLYNKTVFDVLQEEKGKNQAVLFARSATVGGQMFPVHWGGDCNSNYLSMWESLRGGLSLCLSGFGFWSHDIGGFEGNASPDVYKRWLAFGLLSTHSRLHGSTSYRVPWLYGEEAVDVCRKFVKLKNSLMPYIFSNAVKTSRTGIPSMRAMVMEFSELGAEDCDRQYMLGDSLLVAPVMNANHIVDFYLPQGKWTEFFSGKVVEGKGWKKETHDYFSLPLYVRENTILPIGGNEDKTEYEYADGLTLHLYEISQEGTEFEIFDIKGESALKVKALKKENKLYINLNSVPANINIKLHMHDSNQNGNIIKVKEKQTVIEL